MRPLLFLCSLALVALVVPAASAQDPDGPPGCVEANPCEVIVSVDEQGLADVSQTEFASGDWIVATVVNQDSVAHTVKLTGHALSMTVPAGDVEDSAPFKMGSAGTYPLTDMPTNDVQDITVKAAETFSSSGAAKGSPGPAPILLLAGLVLAAGVARRVP